MRLDGDTIQNLYKFKVIDDRLLTMINIINALQAGTRPGIIAERYKVSRQYVYTIRKRVNK